jgi:pyrroline-5-carboxylate reductase
MKYAFLGAGKMAAAIIRGMLRANLCAASDIVAACPEPALLGELGAATGVNCVASNADAAASASVVLLCVKPSDADEALAQAGSGLAGKLLISIAAGLPIGRLASLAPKSRVIRAMPNTPATVGRAATAYACAESATAADRAAAEAVFSGIGTVYPVAENLLNAVTGLSGSGPAYICLVLEALADGGVHCGLPRKLAHDLAVQTVLGTAELVAASDAHPAILRDMVTSPAGTTIAGLRKLEAGGVRSAMIEAVHAAADRARELSGS